MSQNCLFEYSCAVPIRILAGRRASSRKTGEIPPVKETSASLQELKGPGQVRSRKSLEHADAFIRL